MMKHIWMGRRGRGVVVAATMTLVAAAAGAQEPQPITLEEAIEIALERNPTVRQAENSARLGTLAVRQQERALLPDLRLSTSTSAPYATGFDTGNPTVSGGLSTSMQVSNLYSTFASIERAKTDEEQGTQTLVRARQTVVFNVISSFLAAVEAQEQVLVQRENVASAEAQEAQVQAFVEAGRRPISDLYQQQASTAGARLALVQAERALVVARRNVIRNLQLDPFGAYEFLAPEPGPPSTTFASLDLRNLSEQALAQRPDLAAAQLQLTSAEQGVRIADASRWPTLSLSLGYGSNFTSSDKVDFLDQLDQRRGGSLQLGISVPILDNTSGITRERARIQLENARISLENTVQTVATEVQTAYLDLELAEQQLAVAELQLRSTQLALETAQQRYDVGAGTLLEVTQAQVAQVRATTALVNSRYGLLLQSRLMDYYLGELEEAAL